jgi:L-malate glycosyltransferase
MTRPPRHPSRSSARPAGPTRTGVPSAAPPRLRLVKFVSAFHTGGTERQFVNLGLTLDIEQFDLRYACLGRTGELLSEIEERGIPTREYDIRSLYSAGYVWHALRLARDLRRERIDIVHAYSFYGNLVAIPAARLAGVPVVIASIRDCGVYLTPRQQRAQRYVCAMADCILVNAKAIQSWLVDDHYDPSRIAVIGNGVDMTRFRPADRIGDAGVHREFGFPPGAPLVVLVSRLDPAKGAVDLIEAVARLRSRRPDVRALLVGGGTPAATAALQDRTRRLGLERTVVLAGYRDDVPRLLGAAAALVLPSLSEGLPNVLLEAMAVGIPVIATAVGGVPEIVRDGQTGLLVPPADPPALAAAIDRLLTEPDLAAGLGAAGRQLVVERFSMERMVRETEQLYHDLAAHAGRRRRGVTGRARVPAETFAGKRL